MGVVLESMENNKNQELGKCLMSPKNKNMIPESIEFTEVFEKLQMISLALESKFKTLSGQEDDQQKLAFSLRIDYSLI